MYELVWPEEPLRYTTERITGVMYRISDQIDAVFGEHLYLIFDEPENLPRDNLVANVGASLRSIFVPD
jgi:hypothetical protein